MTKTLKLVKSYQDARPYVIEAGGNFKLRYIGILAANLRFTFSRIQNPLDEMYDSRFSLCGPYCWQTNNTSNSSLNALLVSYLEFKSSINSPLWYSSNTERLSVDLKKPVTNVKDLTPPVYKWIIPKRRKPILKLLSNEDLSPLKKTSPVKILYRKKLIEEVNLRRIARFTEAMQVYILKTNDDAQRKAVYDAYFMQLQWNYEKRKANHQKHLDNLERSYLRLRKSRHSDPPENPYRFMALSFPLGCTLKKVYSELTPYPTGECSSYHYWTKSIITSQDENKMAEYIELLGDYILLVMDEHAKELDQKNISKLYQKIRKLDVHVGNLIAERRQTIDMFANLYKRLVDLISLKKSILSKVARYLLSPKKLANDILAFKFGLEPLVSDLWAVQKLLSSEPEGAIVSVHCNSSRFVNISTDQIEFKGRIVNSYVAKLKVEDSSARFLSKFGLINPIEILWEVTPWSFVVDWVLPIGNYIQSLTSFTGLKWYKGTRKVEYVGTFLIKSIPQRTAVPDTQSVMTLAVPDCVFSGRIIDRSVLNNAPENLRSVAFKDPVSFSHITETIALLVQRMRT